MFPAIRQAFPRHILNPLVNLLARLGITPNALTWTGLLICAGAGVLAAIGMYPLAGWVSLLGGGFDMLDGSLARATNQASKFGALLDSTMDRYGEIFLLGGIVVSAANRAAVGEVMLAFAAVAGSLMVSYVKARAEGLGFSCDVGLLTRAERVIILGVALIIGWVVPALVVVAVLANVTAFQRLSHVWKAASEQEER